MNGDEIVKRALEQLPDVDGKETTFWANVTISVSTLLVSRKQKYTVQFDKKYSPRFRDIYWQLVSITK